MTVFECKSNFKVAITVVLKQDLVFQTFAWRKNNAVSVTLKAGTMLKKAGRGGLGWYGEDERGNLYCEIPVNTIEVNYTYTPVLN